MFPPADDLMFVIGMRTGKELMLMTEGERQNRRQEKEVCYRHSGSVILSVDYPEVEVVVVVVLMQRLWLLLSLT